MQQLIQQAVKANDAKLLEKLEANEEELLPGLALYLLAFYDLCSCRQMGFGAVGPIDYISIRNYAIINEFDEEQTTALHYYMNHMDAAFLKEVNKEPKQSKEIGNANGEVRKGDKASGQKP